MALGCLYGQGYCLISRLIRHPSQRARSKASHKAYKPIRSTISSQVFHVSLYLCISAASRTNQEHRWRLLFATVCASLFRLIIEQTKHTTQTPIRRRLCYRCQQVYLPDTCAICAKSARIGARQGEAHGVGQCCCCCCCCLQFN